MNIEKIFRQVPELQGLSLDKILFESRYPVMFTCRNDDDIYLFICCLVNADKIQWIGTKTNHEMVMVN